MATINGRTQRRTTLIADTADLIEFDRPIQKISFVATSPSMTDTIYIKPVTALVGINATAWANDLLALKLTTTVRSVELFFAGPISAIYVGSAGGEEIQWYSGY